MKYTGKHFVPVCRVDYMISVLWLALQYSSFIWNNCRQGLTSYAKQQRRHFDPLEFWWPCFCCFRLPAVQRLLRDDDRRAHPPTEVLRRGECTDSWRNYMHSGIVVRGGTGIDWNKINKNVWKVIWEGQGSCGMNYVETKLIIVIFFVTVSFLDNALSYKINVYNYVCKNIPYV
jgi:hypothetical protein